MNRVQISQRFRVLANIAKCPLGLTVWSRFSSLCCKSQTNYATVLPREAKKLSCAREYAQSYVAKRRSRERDHDSHSSCIVRCSPSPANFPSMVRAARSFFPMRQTRCLHAPFRVKDGVQVVICHPKLVETGLDLLGFPTIIFYGRFRSAGRGSSDHRTPACRSARGLAGFDPGVPGQANNRWEMKILGSNAFERSYMLEGAAGEHRPEVIQVILGKKLRRQEQTVRERPGA